VEIIPTYYEACSPFAHSRAMETTQTLKHQHLQWKGTKDSRSFE